MPATGAAGRWWSPIRGECARERRNRSGCGNAWPWPEPADPSHGRRAGSGHAEVAVVLDPVILEFGVVAHAHAIDHETGRKRTTRAVHFARIVQRDVFLALQIHGTGQRFAKTHRTGRVPPARRDGRGNRL